MDYIYLDKTAEILNMILEEYKKLNEDDILVIDYTGSPRTHLYHILEWYISYESGQSKLHFAQIDERIFDYYKLIEQLNNNAIEYINYHISIERISQQFKNSVSLDYSMHRDFETVSKFYIADNVGEKVKVRALKIKE